MIKYYHKTKNVKEQRFCFANILPYTLIFYYLMEVNATKFYVMIAILCSVKYTIFNKQRGAEMLGMGRDALGFPFILVHVIILYKVVEKFLKMEDGKRRQIWRG